MRFHARGQHHLVAKSALRGWRLVLAPLFVIVLWRYYITLDLDPVEADRIVSAADRAARRS